MLENTLIVHPLVLLSAVDHYKRMGTPRVIGILLGTDDDHITNSFAIPFEEDEENWFYDISYLYSMFDLFHRVNSKEKIVEWYHTGPQMCKNDIEITKSLIKIVKNPYLIIINIHSDNYDLPVQIFRLNKQKEFVHVNATIEAEEAEEVGVEHLIRDMRQEMSGSLKDRVNTIKESLKMYFKVLKSAEDYLMDVKNGNIDYRHEIINLLQDVINSMPKLDCDLDYDVSNIYLCEMIKTTVSLNDLKKNRMENEIASI
ncbi:26s proteasome non-atpase regulatory subunit 7 [Vairimorpha apis BRL 01]|uniref:26s proteasome non-atpase regulatory subunit 7 n=1 Tax=Vairimorpha apis BRL 01 TaxID=1037528 RepID=T0LAB2_9MICR|nr:26s proteasome non-atpase regulatory subunit 7 [Vairimorpha apis BRL 01]